MEERTGKIEKERWTIEDLPEGGMRLIIDLPPNFNHEVLSIIFQQEASHVLKNAIRAEMNKWLYGEGNEKPDGFIRR